MEQSSRPARKVAIADHIWDAFEEMAEAMGSDRDGLINQAMFMFARLNGFLEAGGAHAKLAEHTAARAAQARIAPPVLQPVSSNPEPAPAHMPVAAAPGRPARAEPPAQQMDEEPQPREIAERVLETSAELERLLKGRNAPPPEPVHVSPLLDEVDEAPGMEVAGDTPVGGNEQLSVDEGEEGGLYLMAEGGNLDKVSRDRFVIGRGKHCDFVINSGKVSREHAAITREGDDWFIEDLGSSNGTWFNKQRIKRRRIEDGDEYFICNEKIKLVYR